MCQARRRWSLGAPYSRASGDRLDERIESRDNRGSETCGSALRVKRVACLVVSGDDIAVRNRDAEPPVVEDSIPCPASLWVSVRGRGQRHADVGAGHRVHEASSRCRIATYVLKHEPTRRECFFELLSKFQGSGSRLCQSYISSTRGSPRRRGAGSPARLPLPREVVSAFGAGRTSLHGRTLRVPGWRR